MSRIAIMLILLTIESTVLAAEPLSLSTVEVGIFAKGGGPGSYGFFIHNAHETDPGRKDAAEVVKYFDGVKEPAREIALLYWSGPFACEEEQADLQTITNALRQRQIAFGVMQLGFYDRKAENFRSALCLMRDARPRSETPEYHYFLGFRYLGSGEVGVKMLLADAPKQAVKNLFVACDSRFDPQAIVRVCKERYADIFPYGKVSPINPADEWVFRKCDPYQGDDDYQIGHPKP